MVEGWFQLYQQTDCSISASKLLFCLICFTASLKVRSRCTTSFLIQMFLVITGEFSRLTQVRSVSASEHCLDLFTTSLSITTKAANGRCLSANNPLDLRFNL